ncbi:DUF2783 domain-containing protein [Ideonella sp. A 288]|uniref:DUF2783 domain-containing protein n=1 Tax=Ideonella sp. A 288 TaxID=1962181 RepID=UPI000B4B9874|nr:DUF2783 domain-containing protein [Ideonella sp. A 288]
MSTTSDTTAPEGLRLADLEQVYDHLAEALDTAGPAHGELFLVKLALLLAQRLGDAHAFDECVRQALVELPG